MVIPSSQASQEDKDARFTHLLRPIRDLTKNWNIDIAHDLEDFLEELDKITISFDGGATTMNFAEAALLVQGSACVYSKKVEYLYSLAYQVLDLISSKRKLNQKSSVDNQGNDRDVTFRNEVEEDLLSLDDVVEQRQHKNTDLKEGTDGKSTIKDSPNTPLLLIKLDADAKGDNSLLSRKGELLGNKNDFRMNASNLHMTGTMMLDLTQLALLEATMPNQMSTPQIILQENGDMNRSEAIDALGGPVVEPMDVHDDDGAGDDLGGFDDVDGIAEDPVLPEANAVEENKNGQDQMMPRKSERQRKQVVLFEENKRPAKIIRDPWETQNSHANVVPEKKLKKSRTFKVPAKLSQEATTKRKRKKKQDGVQDEEKLQPLREFMATVCFSRASKLPSKSLKVPSFPELESLYWAEYKKRQAMHKREAKILAQQCRFEELEDREEEEDVAPQAELGDAAADDDDDDGGFDPPADPFPNVLDALGIGDDGPQYEDNIQERGFEYPATQSQDSSVVQTYEDLVRQHVESYISSAQHYAQITELSRRVSDWEEKLLPKLEQEERNGVFDIHRYGTSVLESFCEEDSPMDDDQKMPFRYVAQGKNIPNVCRLFAATLQLANNYNVEISTEGCLDESMDTMALRLLSTKRHHEELEDYRAPSID